MKYSEPCLRSLKPNTDMLCASGSAAPGNTSGFQSCVTGNTDSNIFCATGSTNNDRYTQCDAGGSATGNACLDGQSVSVSDASGCTTGTGAGSVQCGAGGSA